MIQIYITRKKCLVLFTYNISQKWRGPDPPSPSCQPIYEIGIPPSPPCLKKSEIASLPIPLLSKIIFCLTKNDQTKDNFKEDIVHFKFTFKYIKLEEKKVVLSPQKSTKKYSIRETLNLSTCVDSSTKNKQKNNKNYLYIFYQV